MASIIGVETLQHTNGTTAATIDSNGVINEPKKVRFLAKGNNDAYVNTSPIPFPTEAIDVGGGYNPSTYKFTAPVAGTYMFQGNFGLFRNDTSNNYGYFSLMKNDTTVHYTYTQIPTSSLHDSASFNVMLELAVNDVVHINYNSTGTAKYYNGANECQFSGYLLA